MHVLTADQQQQYDAERLKRLAANGGWIGVDLDGTLAQYGGFKGHGHIGAPIPRMVERVKAWLLSGVEVRVFTARAGDAVAEVAIGEWCLRHVGALLPVTNQKDHRMIELWDDRAVQVRPNTGERVDGLP